MGRWVTLDRQARQGAAGPAGTPADVYVGWASDTNGTAFSTTPAPGLNYLAVLATNGDADADGREFRWVVGERPRTAGAAGANGCNGTNGASVYGYVGYASDANGTAYSPTPGTGLNYIAIKLSSTPISVPTAATFAGLWQLYAMTTPPVVPATHGRFGEGTTNLYFTAARVLAVALAGLDGTVTGAVTMTDSILSAFGKLQNRLANVESAMSSPSQALFAEGTIAVVPARKNGDAEHTDAGLHAVAGAADGEYSERRDGAGGGGGGCTDRDGLCVVAVGGGPRRRAIKSFTGSPES